MACDIALETANLRQREDEASPSKKKEIVHRPPGPTTSLKPAILHALYHFVFF